MNVIIYRKWKLKQIAKQYRQKSGVCEEVVYDKEGNILSERTYIDKQKKKRSKNGRKKNVRKKYSVK